MAGVTVTGAVANTRVSIATSSALQSTFAQQIISSSNSTSQLVTGSGGPATSPLVVDVSALSLITGAVSVPSVQVVLAGQFGTYTTGGTTLSTVVAADNSNSSIANTNPTGGLLAVTGAGANLLQGLAGVNQFVTGTGGQDGVTLSGLSNNLTSNGADGVLVGGPSTISAGATGEVGAQMAPGATLAFVNGSAPNIVDSITGAAGGSLVIAGTGNTSVTSGAGPEIFLIDTSAGNVTLNGSLQNNDTFAFVKNAAVGTNQTLVTNFATGDQVLVHGYAGYNVTAAAGNPAGSVLTLSDGSQVTFSNVSAAVLQQTVKTF